MKYRNPFFAFIIFTLLPVFSSCSRPSPEKTSEIKLPLSGDSSEVVMISGDLKMTMADYHQCIVVHRLQGRFFSKRALANPRFQRDEASRCFSAVFLRDYMEKNNIRISESDIRDYISRAMERLQVGNEAALAEKLEIPESELASAAQAALVPMAVQKSLYANLTPQESRLFFDIDERQITVEIADFDNTPNEDEIKDYLANHQDALSAYISSHPWLQNGEPQVKFVTLSYPIDNNIDNDDPLKAAQKLRLTAIQQGLDAAIESCRIDAALGCRIVNDKDKPLIQSRNDENQWAFKMPLGSVSDVQLTSEDRRIFISTDLVPPQPRNMNDPNILRELASIALKDTTGAKHILDILKPSLESPNPNFRAIAAEIPGSHFTSGTWTLQELQKKKIVESEKVFKVISDLKPEEIDLFSNPIIENGRMIIFRVIHMRQPSDEDYARNQAEWRLLRAEDPDLRALKDWLEPRLPKMTTRNLTPIQIKYGTLQTNGSITF